MSYTLVKSQTKGGKFFCSVLIHSGYKVSGSGLCKRVSKKFLHPDVDLLYVFLGYQYIQILDNPICFSSKNVVLKKTGKHTITP